jgi:hypothetical protein
LFFEVENGMPRPVFVLDHEDGRSFLRARFQSAAKAALTQEGLGRVRKEDIKEPIGYQEKMTNQEDIKEPFEYQEK